MEIKTFRAKTMQQALDLVRSELGAEATVLHTRELNGTLVKRWVLGRSYEVAATGPPPAPQPKQAPSQAPPTQFNQPSPSSSEGRPTSSGVSLDLSSDYGDRYRAELAAAPASELDELKKLVDGFRDAQVDVSQAELPVTLFDLFTEMIDADVDEATAREMIEHLQQTPTIDLNAPLAARGQLLSLIEAEFQTTGPIQPAGEQARVVALVGPTGVGKTTTIAKLAANYRLREGRRVGLITVDTYRIAAVEQLRTYAEIIDLPMEVVSTPREMREAAARMQPFDLVLVDTAGRSPRDDVRIQELRAMLAEARPDEVHLVLSAVSSGRALAAAAERFAPAGVTSLLVSKLDEASTLGQLLAVARKQRLPFSYLTDGQNVPDDIEVATPRQLAEAVLGIQPSPISGSLAASAPISSAG